MPPTPALAAPTATTVSITDVSMYVLLVMLPLMVLAKFALLAVSAAPLLPTALTAVTITGSIPPLGNVMKYCPVLPASTWTSMVLAKTVQPIACSVVLFKTAPSALCLTSYETDNARRPACPTSILSS